METPITQEKKSPYRNHRDMYDSFVAAFGLDEHKPYLTSSFISILKFCGLPATKDTIYAYEKAEVITRPIGDHGWRIYTPRSMFENVLKIAQHKGVSNVQKRWLNRHFIL